MTNNGNHTRSAPLESLVTISGGGTPSKRVAEYFTGDIPWVTPKDMKSWFIDDAEDHITEKAIAESSTNLVKPGAVLVCIRSGVLAHTLPVAINRVAVTLNQDMKAFRCAEELYAPYLARFLKWYSPHLLRTVRGTTAHNLSMDVVKRIEIPLPPLPEQRRIADILDKADAIRRKWQDAESLIQKVPLAAFREIFAEFLDPKRTETELSDTAEVVSGVAKGRKLNGDEIRQVPYLRVANVQAGFLDLTEIKTIPAKQSEVDSLALQHGDVVLTEGGDHDKLGRGALWEHDVPDCIHQNHVFRVRVDRKRLLPTFFVHFLQTEIAKAYFLRCAKKTTNLASINMTQLRALPVPLPPMKLQERFDQEFRTVTNVINRQAQAEREAGDLFNSLVQRAFKGEL